MCLSEHDITELELSDTLSSLSEEENEEDEFNKEEGDFLKVMMML